MAELMPRATDVLEAGMRSKLHVGAQLSVFFNGSSACDLAIGVCAPGRPMRRRTVGHLSRQRCEKSKVSPGRQKGQKLQ